ncbi:DUF1127 domain-containing protein [Sedimenticola selenatireducens]|uniref:DUF1127 domain-containing protein n=1 Tax=Sedimenticola selenatireducens TaxID=191960 RepID=UPI001FDFD119|nr:DUF1127 domain-containing protein [Sedimenticola selenatireducens]
MRNTISMGQSFTSAISRNTGISKPRRLTVSWLLRQLTDRFHRWRMLARERYLLQTLSDEMLKDIGISRLDAEQEARRPFWDDQGIKR